MNRPFGHVTSKNLHKELMDGAKWMVSQLKNLDGVIGITLSGGLCRGYGDELSEIDLMIYLEKETYEKWTQGQGPVPQGDNLWEGRYFDLEFFSYEEEWEKDWGLFMKWDASYNVILYDPYNKIAQLFKHKDLFTAQEKFQCASECFENCFYLGDLVIQQWIKRGDPLAANYLINKAISGLVKMVFLANNEYPPVEKWALNYSYSLKWLPNKWKERISNIIVIKDVTMDEVKRRHNKFVSLYKECWEKIVGTESKDLEFIEIVLFKEFQYIIANYPVEFNKFAEKYETKHLSYEPMFQLLNIIEKDGKKYIIFDEEKYNEYMDLDFKDFLDWNKNLLRKLKK